MKIECVHTYSFVLCTHIYIIKRNIKIIITLSQFLGGHMIRGNERKKYITGRVRNVWKIVDNDLGFAVCLHFINYLNRCYSVTRNLFEYCSRRQVYSFFR